MTLYCSVPSAEMEVWLRRWETSCIFCWCIAGGVMAFCCAPSMQPHCHHHHHHTYRRCPPQPSVHSSTAQEPIHPQLSSSAVNPDPAFTPLVAESSQGICASTDSETSRQPTHRYVLSHGVLSRVSSGTDLFFVLTALTFTVILSAYSLSLSCILYSRFLTLSLSLYCFSSM